MSFTRNAVAKLKAQCAWYDEFINFARQSVTANFKVSRVNQSYRPTCMIAVSQCNVRDQFHCTLIAYRIADS